MESAENKPARTTAEKLADLHARLEQSLESGSARAIAKRKELGHTSPRERITELLDKGTFVEIGQLAKTPGDARNPYGDGVVTGRGLIDGRPVVVYAHDNTVFGGSVGEAFGKKVCAIMDLAIKTGCPIIGINDSGGARVQDAVTSLAFYSEISQRQYPASGFVPQISIMLGKCAGGAAYAPVTTDFVVGVQDTAYMFVTGPDVIKQVTGEDTTIEELGSALNSAKYGNMSHVAASEHDAFTYVRNLLSFMPSTCSEKPPRVNPGLEPELTDTDLSLNEFIPDSDTAVFDMHDLLIRIFDDGEFCEVFGQFAPNILTGFARVDGYPVGVVANQPMDKSGCIDIDAAEKASRFIRTCNSYGIPLVFVVDVPGYLPGVDQEKNGVIHRGAKFGYALCESSVPKVTIVVRRAYGGGYAVMGSKNMGGDLNFAWPTARIAVMGADGAVDLLRRREIEAAGPVEGPKLRKQLMDFYNEYVATPYTAAERGYIDAVIEPAQTRLYIRQALQQLADKQRPWMPHHKAIFPL